MFESYDLFIGSARGILRKLYQKFLIYRIKKHLTHEVCHRKFGRLKGTLVRLNKSVPQMSDVTNGLNELCSLNL